MTSSIWCVLATQAATGGPAPAGPGGTGAGRTETETDGKQSCIDTSGETERQNPAILLGARALLTVHTDPAEIGRKMRDDTLARRTAVPMY